MIAYASRTGTRRNLRKLRENSWRIMVSARGALRTEGFPYALDNGAWTAFQKKQQFDEGAFWKAVDALGHGSDFIVVPDIVGGGMASLDFSLSYLPKLRGIAPLLLAVQDGMTPSDVASIVNQHVGIFVGGSTEWKEQTMMTWGTIARERRAWLHCGRVNSERRIALCVAAGVNSIDGSSASRFAVTTDRLSRSMRQLDFFAPT